MPMVATLVYNNVDPYENIVCLYQNLQVSLQNRESDLQLTNQIVTTIMHS